jgi:hypothetical protein
VRPANCSYSAPTPDPQSKHGSPNATSPANPPSNPPYHHGCQMPNWYWSQLGGLYEVCWVVTSQLTSASGSGPPAKYAASTATVAGSDA